MAKSPNEKGASRARWASTCVGLAAGKTEAYVVAWTDPLGIGRHVLSSGQRYQSTSTSKD